MSLLTRTRRPKPFLRHNRADYEHMIASLSRQRDLAKGEARATVEWVASWLEQRAAAYDHDADHLQRLGATPANPAMTVPLLRILAGELRDCAIDAEGQR